MVSKISPLKSEDGLARLTLNRPKAANAFNLDLAREFLETATICAKDPAIRAVLLTGAGRMFCAGWRPEGLLGSGGSDPEAGGGDTAGALHAAIVKFARMNAPIVAAVNGPAAGAGMSLVCMTDIALAAESAHLHHGIHRSRPHAGWKFDLLSYRVSSEFGAPGN